MVRGLHGCLFFFISLDEWYVFIAWFVQFLLENVNIIPILPVCWTLSIAWGIFHIGRVLGYMNWLSYRLHVTAFHHIGEFFNIIILKFVY
jgi:hypothetical protein